MAKNSKVDIKKKPTVAVKSLGKPKRSESGSNIVFTASWDYPDAAFSEKSDSRFQGVIVKWIIDFDMGSTKVKKNRTKKASLSNTKQRLEFTQRYSGKDQKSASYELPRGYYYPNVASVKGFVKVYRVTAAKWLEKKSKWKITGKAYVMGVPLDELNRSATAKGIYSRDALVKLSKTTAGGIKGRLFYISKSPTNKDEFYTESEGKPVVDGVGVQIQGWNSRSSFSPYTVGTGNNKKAATVADKKHVLWTAGVPVAETYFDFTQPPRPVFGVPTIGGMNDSYIVKFPITADNDDGTVPAERYQSRVRMYKETGFYDSYDSNVLRLSGPANILGGNEGEAKLDQAFTPSRYPQDDMPSGRNGVQTLRADEFIKYTTYADNQGISGDSAVDKNGNDAYSSFLIARPHDVSIVNVVEQGSYYRITFSISGDNARRKTTGYRLERLYDFRPEPQGDALPVDDWTEAQWDKAAAEASDSSWVNTELTLGHRNEVRTQAFTELILKAKPSPFRRTYYRVVPFNDIEGLAGVPSAPVVAPGFLSIPSAINQKAKILSCSSAENGNSIMAVVAFNKTKNSSGFYNSNGTEMSWDTFAHAWQSSHLPSSHDFKDDTVSPILVTSERKADESLKKFLAGAELNWCYATYYLRDVQPSEKYYVKARRFLKDTETRETDSYGDYAEYSQNNALATIEVKAAPTKVKLEVPERLVEGKDLSVSWSYDSVSEQKAYQLSWLTGTGLAAFDKAQELLQKEDSAPYAVVPWSSVEPVLVGAEGTKDHLYLAVRMCVEEGNWSDFSEAKAVKIVRPPKASLGQMATVQAIPFTNTFGTDDPKCSIVVRIVADQLSDWGPTGRDDLAEGSIAYTAKVQNVPWREIELDDGTKWYWYDHLFENVPLRNGARYTMEYTAINDELDLSSDTVDVEGNIVKQTTSFNVSYPDEMTLPEFYVVADPVDDEHRGFAYISIPDTPDLNQGCVAELYRVTPSGAYLVKDKIDSWRNATIIDRTPPYSRNEPCTYRLALRSSNGIVNWKDRSYAMPGYSIRFDWGDSEDEKRGSYTHLTIPYNLKWSDSWTKNSRVDLHLDGTYNGYWRGGVDHKNNLSTELVKLTGADQVARVIALAKYAGPVTVRLPNGSAFYADVQVNNLDVSYDSLVITASFSAQEIRPSRSVLERDVTVTNGLYKPENG